MELVFHPMEIPWRDTLPIRLLLILLYPVQLTIQQELKQICKNEIQFYNNKRFFFYKRFLLL